MSYVIQALVGGPKAMSLETVGDLALVTLPQDIMLAPLTGTVRARRGLNECPLTDEGAEPLLPASVLDLLRTASLRGRIAYIEAELFGGAGLQACLLADGGDTVGPIYRGSDAINKALSFLGVIKGHSRDEFDAVNLGLHRSTDDWTGAAEQ